MLQSISNSYTALRGHQQMLDVTAHNLANVNSNAYKEKQVSFHELPYRGLAQRRLPTSGNSPAQFRNGSGVALSSVTASFDAGILSPSKNQWDMAVAGEGFFRVVRPDGSYAYTRSGNFTMDAEGNLSLSGGSRLDLSLDFQDMEDEIDFSSLNVTPEGSIYAYAVRKAGDELKVGEEGGFSQVAIELGKLTLYRFTNPQSLSSLGGNLFLPSEATGPPQEGVGGDNGFGQIRQGYLEEANVEISRQMTMLILGQRALQASARALTAADEIWGITLNLQT
ncbi:MAG: flagellar hook-basal body protein [Bacillota bacterium]|nr:flagellar hook-basal body protein [Bacillota bacterium]